MAQFAVENLAQVNEFLSNNNYLNGDLPGADDVRIFNALKGVPPKDQFPEVYFWYLLLSSFTPAVRAQWAPAAAPKKDAPKKEAPKKEEPKKEEPKKAEDDVDLFGDDDVDPEAEKKAKALAEQKKQEALAKKNKPKPVAKTIVIFEVKIFEATDQALLESTAKKVKETINPDGLTWGKEVKFEEIAYGAKKIVMSMIIEDDKILTDDVFDQITAWEDDVSSVDIVSMQKV
ncbi:unnamed protein product (macronuclear) [Paramecium tetraurelia]|uniref:Translation elongation factor EF1B beta/delta subunit guanine nucleotide exchange domain-containing protein n=1 Tax=Paramecium tetraurelia TaxID=5888 RepID=A0BNC9_PARTE|nr:uncharacterized protein GSPATT00030684001 [Paramecium tetraurelia]CAK60046.1 unnamed protein product [Paramecium tetraurelia]|eukprot:XP_001427444.1 hypothetical protein (macronuclear) [Paramecium tetraurelia strain d4-2]